MLKERVLAALVLIPLVIIAIFLLPIQSYGLILIALIGLAAWEWAQFVGIKQGSSRWGYTLLFVVVAALSYYFILYSESATYMKFWLYLSLVWWVLALILVITYPNSEKSWKNSAIIKTGFGMATLIPLFCGMIWLRAQNPGYQGGFWVLYVLVLVWATDTGAYFAGRKFGKNKLAPKVSPGKTREGLIGGVVLASVVGCIAYLSGFFPVSFGLFFGTTFITIFISVLGDLAESMFKRQAGIKDSGNVIPGHGGILDRIDSLTAAIPVFSALIILFS